MGMSRRVACATQTSSKNRNEQRQHKHAHVHDGAYTKVPSFCYLITLILYTTTKTIRSLVSPSHLSQNTVSSISHPLPLLVRLLTGLHDPRHLRATHLTLLPPQSTLEKIYMSNLCSIKSARKWGKTSLHYYVLRQECRLCRPFGRGAGVGQRMIFDCRCSRYV